jgi:hypothetical protein
MISLRRLLLSRTLARAATCVRECCGPAVFYHPHVDSSRDGPWKYQEQPTSTIIHQEGGINAPTNAKQPAHSNSFIIQQNTPSISKYKMF